MWFCLRIAVSSSTCKGLVHVMVERAGATVAHIFCRLCCMPTTAVCPRQLQHVCLKSSDEVAAEICNHKARESAVCKVFARCITLGACSMLAMLCADAPHTTMSYDQH